VRPAASVHPEPGSNSSSLVFKAISQALFYLTTKGNLIFSTQNGLFSVEINRFQLISTLSINMFNERLLKSKLCAFIRKAGANIKPFSYTHNTFYINFEKKGKVF
ncbi:MAG: hypothetical protein ACPH8A_07725, partial [Flavobacteriaceae bacterium]